MFKVIFHIYLHCFFIQSLYCCGCCVKKDKLRYNDKTDELCGMYLKRVKCSRGKKLTSKELEEILKKVREIDETNVINSDKKGFTLQYIDYDSITMLDGIDMNSIEELKKQVRFIAKVSYIYLLEFLLRVSTQDEEYANFMLTINGAGGPVLQSAGFVNLIVGENLCSEKCSLELSQKGLSSETLDKGAKGIFTNVPIFDVENSRIYTNTANSFSFYNGKCFDMKENKKNVSMINFYLLCEYLAQLGNPLFAICNGYEMCVASIYNALEELNSFLKLPFYQENLHKIIKVFDRTLGGEVKKANTEDIFKELEGLGCVGEMDMILFAEVIVLNNLLYYVYLFASAFNKKVICNLTFSSYGGRVFEMLMSLIKNGYDRIRIKGEQERKVFVDKCSLTAVFIHALIGNNELKQDKKNSFFSNKNIFNVFAGGAVSRDRLKYFSSNDIFGDSFNSLMKFYYDNVNSNKINQIISKFKKRSGGSFLKNLFRWDIDEAISSFYSSDFSDGMLSSDGLFIYNDRLTKEYISDIIDSRINDSAFSFYKNSNTDCLENNKVFKIKNINIPGSYVIEGDYVRYLHMGGGSHVCVDEEKDSYEIYENRGEKLKSVLKVLYGR